MQAANNILNTMIPAHVIVIGGETQRSCNSMKREFSESGKKHCYDMLVLA